MMGLVLTGFAFVVLVLTNVCALLISFFSIFLFFRYFLLWFPFCRAFSSVLFVSFGSAQIPCAIYRLQYLLLLEFHHMTLILIVSTMECIFGMIGWREKGSWW
nr:uncharacterized protein CTRU02_12537 [Colletotrichum truncatum]KAF6784548.1 hypothetical protein CTRU02_12537 [Colletotrichum truncatum]